MKINRTSKRPSRRVLALALLLAAAPAAAQQAGDWGGFYIGGSLGGSEPSSDGGSRILFDTNLDGGFGDTVRTAAGADAFSPGFCDGAANGRTPAQGCREDKGGAETGLRIGYDWQFGPWVIGALAEYADGDVRDSVAAFSTTPAFYTMTRDLEHSFALRARGGYAFGADGATLAYATAGGVRARLDHSFATSNAANAFPERGGGGDADGWQAGLGIERRVLDNLSVGLEYLYTSVKDEDYRVRATRGNAPATNPFLLVNPEGTDFRRSDEDFEYSNLRLTVSYRF